MRLGITTLLLLLASAAPAIGQSRTETAKIINQADAPVEIREHKQADDRSLIRPDQARYETRFVNRSANKLVAVEFALVKFSLFNEFMGRVYGLNAPDTAIPPGPKLQTAGWESPKEAYPYLTAVVYVSRVRFEDGQIWKANLANVIGDLKKIDPDFDPAVLKKKYATDR